MPDNPTKSQKENDESNFHLDIDAQVVRQLGTELITDAEQALLELVKNSYDADAPWCNVLIESDTNHEVLVPGKKDKVSLKGRISVEGAGTGMDRKALQGGWLTISLSTKRQMKASGLITAKFNRTPLGDKGLGRLGTMKLGDYLRITTHHDTGKNGYEISFLWSECRSGLPLTKVPLSITEVPKSGKVGTTIEIMGLTDPDYWSGEDRATHLTFRLSTLISPFKSFSNFTVGLTFNGKPVDLINFPDKVLNTATTHFESTWDNSTFEMAGQVKLGLFKGNKQEDFERYVLSDQGRTLFEYLTAQTFASRISLKKARSAAWFLEFAESKAWADIPVIGKDRLPIAKPGDFIGELYAFNLNFSRSELENIFNDLGDFSEKLKELSRVYIFRDNFRVRASEDWLRLGEEWTSGGSYYGLRPKNTLGYFAITAQGNPRLLEKSDREGFIENAEWRGFFTLATEFKSFSNNALEELRRGYLDFIRISKEKDSGFPEGTSAEDQASHLGKLAKAAKEIASSLTVSAKDRSKVLSDARVQVNTILKKQKPGSSTSRTVANALAAIDSIAARFDAEYSQVQDIVRQVAEKEKLAEVITARFEQLNSQITETYETVGVGLAAQGVVHELHPLLDEIATRSRKIKGALGRQNTRDASLLGDLDTIRNIVHLIGRKMSFLDPMLRTFRETREDIDFEHFIRDFFELRKDRLDSLGIKVFIVAPERASMSLTINRGRLTQVLDNLTRNSEYWLKDYGLKNPRSKLEIHVSFDNHQLTFSDTGPGVRPPLERVLFDMFVTDKPKGQGHGLGLFIVTQILKAEGCTISLGTKRNEHDRRFEFIVDFSGAIK